MLLRDLSKSNFENPSTTERFNLDLGESVYISTPHKDLKNIIRMHYSPAAIDANKIDHLNFSLTYDGAHAGAVVPMNSGKYIIEIAGDRTDLAGAFLNCEVKIKK